VHNFIILLKQRVVVLSECLVDGVKQVLYKLVSEVVQLILLVVLIYILIVILLHLHLFLFFFFFLVILFCINSIHKFPTFYVLSIVHFIKQLPSYFMQESLATGEDIEG
jgi:hypothetical protein